jgi:hypothetical protein
MRTLDYQLVGQIPGFDKICISARQGRIEVRTKPLDDGQRSDSKFGHQIHCQINIRTMLCHLADYLDVLLMHGIELCVKHWRFLVILSGFGAFSCRKKLRSDASSDKCSDSCLSRGRIRTKSLRFGQFFWKAKIGIWPPNQ